VEQTKNTEFPNWLLDTKGPVKYVLLTDIAGQSAQEIPVSLREYVHLKCHLARLRGCDIDPLKEEFIVNSETEAA
jgi:hypothetical protein